MEQQDLTQQAAEGNAALRQELARLEAQVRRSGFALHQSLHASAAVQAELQCVLPAPGQSAMERMTASPFACGRMFVRPLCAPGSCCREREMDGRHVSMPTLQPFSMLAACIVGRRRTPRRL